jgi:hypothetical protein
MEIRERDPAAVPGGCLPKTISRKTGIFARERRRAGEKCGPKAPFSGFRTFFAVVIVQNRLG